MMSRARGLTRRQFGTGLVSLVSATAVASRAKSETSLPTIDTHAHVFHRGLKLAPGRRYAPDYDAPLALYLEQLDRNGMSNGVLVQPSFLGTDNSYLVESLKTAGGRLRGIAVVDPSVTADELRALDRAGVVGIRLNLVGQPLPDLAAGEWKALLGNVKSIPAMKRHPARSTTPELRLYSSTYSSSASPEIGLYMISLITTSEFIVSDARRSLVAPGVPPCPSAKNCGAPSGYRPQECSCAIGANRNTSTTRVLFEFTK